MDVLAFVLASLAVLLAIAGAALSPTIRGWASRALSRWVSSGSLFDNGVQVKDKPISPVLIEAMKGLLAQALADDRERADQARQAELERAEALRVKEARKAFWSNVAFFLAGIVAAIAITLFVRPIS